MSAYRRSFKKILADHTDAPYDDEQRDFIENIASALYERYDDLPPIEEWPASVRYFYTCYDLNYQVGNGGFAQAAYNVPELIPIALEAYQHFGYDHVAALLSKVVALLPSELAEHEAKGLKDDDVVGTDEGLVKVFAHFDESQLDELGEELPDEFWVDARLQQLVQENRAEFAAIDDLT